ncbi:cytochrome P450 [Sphaerisporangium rufum]|uniref:Cytochrome P450 n=1 Tax=Sphaerisporangium rufum TaxID=1381558 RepID=A0A919R057_9ACTN|nr:cytochrome P450 [Sphaerisporangium rufum]GII77364.1 cytochrome P450 [Sphaerisporangium rufum]
MTSDAWPRPADQTLASLAAEPLLTRDYDADPGAVHERLRAAYGPVAPVGLLGVPVWMVLGFDEVREVLRDDSGVWSKRLDSWRDLTEGRVPANWPLAPAFAVNSSAFQDGSALRQVRDAWTAALAPFQDRSHPLGRDLERAVHRYADDLITVLSEGGAGYADLCAQYARPLPLMVINRLLGFPTAQGDEVFMDIWRMLDAGPEAAQAAGRLMASMAGLAAAKRSRPGDDVPSYLLAARPEFGVDELARELIMLPVLAGDVTASLISNTIVEVLVDPAVRASRAEGVQEIVNRVALANPVMANLTFRFPRTDVKLGAFTIAAGDPVMVSIAGAHADPLFGAAIDPGLMRSTRGHLAWGVGPHRCLGRQLATTMTTIAVDRLFDRFAGLRLALPADQLPWRPSPFVRALRSLPVRFEPAARPAPRPAASGTPPEPAPAAPPARSALWRFLRALRGDRG